MNELTGEAAIVQQLSGVLPVFIQASGWLDCVSYCAPSVYSNGRPALMHVASERVRQLFLPLDDPLTWQ